MPLDTVHTACSHDCPSTCALAVERIDAHRIGRVRGAADSSYTAGVVCAKVARYLERVHHPDRLTQALKRFGKRVSVVVHTKPFDGLQRGVVVVESLWPNAA